MQPSNILKITSLTEGWRDKDSILLHACFQLLSDFVEQEISKFPHINWNVSADVSNSVFKGIEFNPGSAEANNPVNTRDIKKEFEELYAWWQVWKKKDKETNSTFEEDHADYLKENEMLKRLIDLRMYMWT